VKKKRNIPREKEEEKPTTRLTKRLGTKEGTAGNPVSCKRGEGVLGERNLCLENPGLAGSNPPGERRRKRDLREGVGKIP